MAASFTASTILGPDLKLLSKLGTVSIQYVISKEDRLIRSSTRAQDQHLVPSSPVIAIERSRTDFMEISACQLLYHPVESLISARSYT